MRWTTSDSVGRVTGRVLQRRVELFNEAPASGDLNLVRGRLLGSDVVWSHATPSSLCRIHAAPGRCPSSEVHLTDADYSTAAPTLSTWCWGPKPPPRSSIASLRFVTEFRVREASGQDWRTLRRKSPGVGDLTTGLARDRLFTVERCSLVNCRPPPRQAPPESALLNCALVVGMGND